MTDLHDDLPTLADKLAWDNDLKSMCDRVLTCVPPHVFGVHGDWGSGKTSFMRQLQWRLGGEVSVKDGSISSDGEPVSTKLLLDQRKANQLTIATVWFEAWRYQNEPVPVVALLHEMRRQLAPLPALKAKFKKLGTVTARHILGALGDAAKSIGLESSLNAEKIQQIGEKWEAEHFAQELPCDAIRVLLSETIKTLLPNGERARVVVFIDDLDRCNPKAAFRLLEGLKIYLNVPGCVFILGMNEQTLADAIGEEMPLPRDAPRTLVQLRAAHYLEKICTNVLRLSLPPDPSKHFGAWLTVDSHATAIQDAIGSLRCLPPNPRRLKALANQWTRFASCVHWPNEGEHAQTERRAWATRVLIAAYIYQFHRDLWERWRFEPRFWNEIKAWCCGEVKGLTVQEPAPDSAISESRPTIRAPEWVGALTLPEKKLPGSTESWGSNYPDPNAIEIFWIGPLVRAHKDYLTERDFLALLKCGQSV